MSQKYVIVHFIDSAKVPHEFLSSEWPLHVTLLANFTISEPLEQLQSELKNYALQEKPFEIMADGEASFGPNQSIAVSLIQPNQNIQRIHEALSAIATKLGAVFDEPTFMGSGYKPHATIQRTSRLMDKETVRLDDFTLVDMFPDNNIYKRGTITTYKFAGE